MKNVMRMALGIALMAGVVTWVGCTESTQPAGPAERAGASLDKAAEKTVEKTGEAMEKAGDAVEKTGKDLQK